MKHSRVRAYLEVTNRKVWYHNLNNNNKHRYNTKNINKLSPKWHMKRQRMGCRGASGNTRCRRRPGRTNKCNTMAAWWSSWWPRTPKMPSSIKNNRLKKVFTIIRRQSTFMERRTKTLTMLPADMSARLAKMTFERRSGTKWELIIDILRLHNS